MIRKFGIGWHDTWMISNRDATEQQSIYKTTSEQEPVDMLPSMLTSEHLRILSPALHVVPLVQNRKLQYTFLQSLNLLVILIQFHVEVEGLRMCVVYPF